MSLRGGRQARLQVCGHPVDKAPWKNSAPGAWDQVARSFQAVTEAEGLAPTDRPGMCLIGTTPREALEFQVG